VVKTLLQRGFSCSFFQVTHGQVRQNPGQTGFLWQAENPVVTFLLTDCCIPATGKVA
jgi:hypothetical protein